MDAVVVDELTVQYGGFRAVDSVSLTVPEGAIHGLIGPNGAGKTSLFNGTCGQVRPRQGRVHVHGKVLRPGSPCAAWKAGIARTFQKTELFWTLNVREHLDLTRRKAARRHRETLATDRVIAGGGPVEIMRDPVVHEAYLGVAHDDRVPATDNYATTIGQCRDDCHHFGPHDIVGRRAERIRRLCQL